jgi:hypothetical protein
MSYNISTFNLKKLENLQIPLRAFYKSSRKDWHPESRKNNDGSITLSGCEGGGVTGMTADGGFPGNVILAVSDICICGEGSGYFMNEILEPALKESAGFLMASCVWEGGDSINNLIVENGNVKWEDIEI